jgi:hypothetical protein
MTNPSSEPATPGGSAAIAQTDPPTCGAPVPSVPPLPQRVGSIPLPATSAREIQQLADLDLLHRVLDGLKRP